MTRSIGAVVLVVVTAGVVAASHPPEFWRAIAKAEFNLPAGADVAALGVELCELFGSPDPELRDEIGYSTFEAWVFRKKLLNAEALRPVTATLLRNMRVEIGSTGTDAVFRRSFSALALGVISARDNAEPILEQQEFREILDAALQYLAAEKDVRGYDPVKGWMHSAAHTADLVKFLGRSRFVTPADQVRILDAIARKMTSSTVFINGEDERHARAVLSIVNRQDFDRTAFDAWLTRSKPAPLRAALPPAQELYGRQNIINLFSKLEVLLSQDSSQNAAIGFARDHVRIALTRLF